MPFTLDTGVSQLFSAGDIVAKVARTVTGNSAWINIGDVKELIAQLHSDAGTGTAPTLDVKFQTSFDASDVTAVDVTSGAFTQVTTIASMQIRSLTALHKFVKIIWTIAGTTPSFNFGVYVTVRK